MLKKQRKKGKVLITFGLILAYQNEAKNVPKMHKTATKIRTQFKHILCHNNEQTTKPIYVKNMRNYWKTEYQTKIAFLTMQHKTHKHGIKKYQK